jgi:hypothetical protein
MKKPKTLLRFAMMLAGIHAGCSSVGRYENQRQSGDAEVRCANPGTGGLASRDVFVTVEEIDGAAAGKGDGGIYYVRAGTHRLALFVSTATAREARQDFDLEAAADRKYLLVAGRKGHDFIVEVADNTNPEAMAVIASIELKATAGYSPPVEK